MSYLGIENLIDALYWSESETVFIEIKARNEEVEKFPIAREFKVAYKFLDGAKIWTTYFKVKVSDLGSPKLASVEVTGSRGRHPKPITINYSINEVHKFSGSQAGAWLTKEQIEEYNRNAPEPDSVERWQLKLIEQYRFQLFELAVRLGIEHGNPIPMKSPDGELHNIYMLPQNLNEEQMQEFLNSKDRKDFTNIDMKRISNEIGKKIRKKITPEFLKEVADIYSKAEARGEFPTKAVKEFFKCETRTAEDYVKFAREKKFLPPVKPKSKVVSKSTTKTTSKKGEKVNGKGNKAK